MNDLVKQQKDQAKFLRIYVDRHGNRAVEMVEIITTAPTKPKRDLLETIYLCSMSLLGFFVSWYMLNPT